jgi:hypothetical protein
MNIGSIVTGAALPADQAPPVSTQRPLGLP